MEFSGDEIARLRTSMSRTVRELDRRSGAQDDLTRTQISVLGFVTNRKRVSLAQLAELEKINPTMVSRIVGKLEAAGLVLRVPDEADRRVAHVEVTPAGAKLWKRNTAARSELLIDLVTALPEDQKTALQAAIPALESLAELTRSGSCVQQD